ncbi:MAG: hypothetical protein ABI366_10535 [Ginsengibacter sp.]
MKSSKEIKKEIHEYIDNIEDEETLWMVHEEIVGYLKKDNSEKEEEASLTEEQEKQLDEAIRQADAGEVMNFEEFKRRMSLWHTS